MGCCCSQEPLKSPKPDPPASFSWNFDQLQAKQFIVDKIQTDKVNATNIKLVAKEKKPYRIILKDPLSEAEKYKIKIAYNKKKGKGSFSLGVCHYGDKSSSQIVQTIGMRNTVRLFVSQREGEIQSQGQVVFHSKSWAMKENDSIEMSIDISSKIIKWSKQSVEDNVHETSPIPSTFSRQQLYFHLIVYEPETELNVQVEQVDKLE